MALFTELGQRGALSRTAAIALSLAASCAHAPPPAIQVRSFELSDAAGRDGEALLSRLLQVPTVVGSGQRPAEAAERLVTFLSHGRIEARVDRSGRWIRAYARLPGLESEVTAVLLSHLDTRPADPAGGPDGRGPWSGRLDAEGVWGRGALDGKGVAAIHATVLRALADEPPLDIDVVFVAVGAGLDLMQEDLRSLLAASTAVREARWVLTKGGATLTGSEALEHRVATADRGCVRLQVAAVKTRPHQSPSSDAVARAVARALDADRVQRLDRVGIQSAQEASGRWPAPWRWIARVPAFGAWVLPGRLADRPRYRAWVEEPVSLESLPTSGAYRARAFLRVDTLLGTTPGHVRLRIRNAARDARIRVTVAEAVPAAAGRPSARLLDAIRALASSDDPAPQTMVTGYGIDRTGALTVFDGRLEIVGFVPVRVSETVLESRFGAGEHLPRGELGRAATQIGALLRTLSSSTAAATRE